MRAAPSCPWCRRRGRVPQRCPRPAVPLHKAVGPQVLGSAQMSAFQTIPSNFLAQGRAQPGAALAFLPVPAPPVFLQISVTSYFHRVGAAAFLQHLPGPRRSLGSVWLASGWLRAKAVPFHLLQLSTEPFHKAAPKQILGNAFLQVPRTASRGPFQR